MLNYIKDISSGFFVLMVCFAYSTYFIIAQMLRIPLEGAAFHFYNGVLAVIVVLVFLKSIHRIPASISIGCLLLCSAMIVLYFSTRFFYHEYTPLYHTYFLAVGARFVPSVLMGAYIASKDGILDKIERAIIPFVLLFTLVMAYDVLTAETGENAGLTYDNGYVSYQSISYYSIYAFGFTMYLMSRGRYSDSSIRKCVFIALAVIQVFTAISAGGRGAFVLLCLFLLYFGSKHQSIGKLIVFFLGVIGIFFVIHATLANNEASMVGVDRLINFFGSSDNVENDGRWIGWKSAWDAFVKSPVYGHGIGSVFYEVGMYSHNIFTDMLCEGGVILVSIFIFILAKVARNYRTLVAASHRNVIMLVVFLNSFVHLCFSGYYLEETGIWVSISYFICNKQLNCCIARKSED